MKKLLSLLSLLAVGSAHAAGTVDFLEVDNDVVLFSTSATKMAASPACVVAETANLWTVSLASDSGRAIYSLILTSMAKGDSVALNIESAQDCADKAGIERANKVNLIATSETPVTSSSGTKSIGLYKGDGITRLGTVLEMGDTPTSWYYATTEGSTSSLYVANDPNLASNTVIYFTSAGCTGTDYASSGYKGENIKNDAYNNGQIYRVSTTSSSVTRKSHYDQNGVCIEHVSTSTLYAISNVIVPVCGEKACVIKVE